MGCGGIRVVLDVRGVGGFGGNGLVWRVMVLSGVVIMFGGGGEYRIG